MLAISCVRLGVNNAITKEVGYNFSALTNSEKHEASLLSARPYVPSDSSHTVLSFPLPTCTLILYSIDNSFTDFDFFYMCFLTYVFISNV